ncbi:1626_t:CDS:2, partial [Scutellospora calospora]
IESYLHKLYQSKQSWACCFTTQVFNAEIQSTQCVECYNNLIKSSVNQTSSLIKLNNAIQERLDSENKCYSYNILQEHYDNEPELTDECIEDNYDSQQIYINSMLNNMLDNKIQEAWHVVRLTGSKKPNKKFLQDRIHYSKSYRLLQTILTLAIEIKTDEEVNDWYHQFIQQKKELLKANTAS